MKKTSLLILSVVALCAASASAAVKAKAHWTQNPSQIQHVLLISVDGMHAVDFQNCSQGIPGFNNGQPYCPNLAALSTTGVNYVAASTSRPSDSFPGLMSIVSGGTPRTMGVYYDVAYDRSLSAPKTTTGNGVASGPCTPYGQPTGTTTEYEEGIDIDQSKVNGGAAGAALTNGTVASIDPNKLPRDPKLGCAPVWPWNFVRTNTIFGVIHNAGGYTSWFDKHPAYSSVAGPDGIGVMNDFYAPEINSTVIGLPGVQTPTGVSCATVRDPRSDISAWTNSFQNIQCYDTLKVNAILNQIAGLTHDGKPAQVPTIFGMNFQAVSVGQKLIEKATSMTGGYKDSIGTPTAGLFSEIQFVDDSLGEMMNAIKDNGLYDSTLVIITAKHGQSPIDPNLWNPILKETNGSSPANLLGNAMMLPHSEDPNNSTGIGPTEDDVSLIWLKPGSSVKTAVTMLEAAKANGTDLGLGQIYWGPTLAMNYNVPGLPPNDPRTPDIIVTPNIGVTYTGSSKKLMEHGGFSHDDTNVILLLSNPGIAPKTVFASVGTNQIAPTILQTLGLDPQQLEAVRLEGTAPLPQ